MDKLKYLKEDPLNIEEIKRFIGTVDKPLLIVGIGTPKLILDSVGPYIATQLQVRGFKVRGTLTRPVHALNIRKFIKSINLNEYFVVAIDASVGEDIGAITIRKGNIRPGVAVGKNLPPIGDLAISLTVATPLDFYDKSPEAINNALGTDPNNLIDFFREKLVYMFRQLRKEELF